MANYKEKQLYDEKGESWIMKTNDFSYYISLKKKGIPTEFTGKSADLEQLLDDLTGYLLETYGCTRPSDFNLKKRK
tara:strand:- start:403 stop:630 length:228 start_codon:yes stop_codon:yes gene_type:complete